MTSAEISLEFPGSKLDAAMTFGKVISWERFAIRYERMQGETGIKISATALL
jgi:hypothetical protein